MKLYAYVSNPIVFTCCCWYQVKLKKSDTDLLGDQLREVFHHLSHEKINTTKLDKRLDEVLHKWDEVKKAQPQVKSNVEPVQVGGPAVA